MAAVGALPALENTAIDRIEQYRKWLEMRGGECWGGVVIKGGRLIFAGKCAVERRLARLSHLRQRGARRAACVALRILMRGWVVLAVVPALLALDTYPDPDWPVTTDYQAVNTAADRIEQYRKWLEVRGGEYWAGVVIKAGRLIFAGRGPRCHVRQKNDCGSILKPLQSTVLGAALYQGKLRDIDENAMRYWSDPYPTPYENDRAITFRQFAQFQDRWNEKEPAGTYRYNNSGATAAGACLAGLFGEVRGLRPKGIAEVARREVMEKIHADWDLWYWEADFSSNPQNAGPRMVLESSVYELAKLAYLWLRKGQWNGTRIFSESYYKEATTDWSPHTGSDAFGFVGHYGYWWFVNAGQILLPDVPADAFYHIGNGSPNRATMLLIIPSHDTVAVLSMERLSDQKKWDVILNSRSPANDGPRLWSEAVAKLHVPRSR